MVKPSNECNIILFSWDPCITCNEMIREIKKLGREIKANINLKVINEKHEFYDISKAPLTVFYGVHEGRLRFVGWMCCHMENVVKEALQICTGIKKPIVRKDLITTVKSLDKIDVKIFTSPLCAIGCPDVARVFIHLTALCNNVTCTVLGILETLDYMVKQGINEIPTIIINDKQKFVINVKSYEEAQDSILLDLKKFKRNLV